MSEHLPGPWHWEDWSGNGTWRLIDSAGCPGLRCVRIWHRRRGVPWRNAGLRNSKGCAPMMTNPTLTQKLRVWAPQIVMLLFTNVAIVGAYASSWNHPIVFAQATVAWVVGGGLLAITSCKKAVAIVDHKDHWQHFLPPAPCAKCAELTADRDELREALATLRIGG